MVKYRLDDIVKEYLIEIGDSQLNRYARFYQYAVSGIREWNMDMTGIPKIAELEINDNDTVDLPSDYLNYSFIGFCSGGVIYPLGENNKICLDKKYDACGAPVSCSSTNDNTGSGGIIANPISYIADHFRNGEVMGRFFGLNGGQNTNGYFRIDEGSNQLKLQGLISTIDGIYMEYIADIAADTDGDFVIHPFMLETLKAWMYWKSIQRDRNFGLGEKQLAENAYKEARRVSRRRIVSKPLSEWYRAIRHGNSASVKF